MTGVSEFISAAVRISSEQYSGGRGVLIVQLSDDNLSLARTAGVVVIEHKAFGSDQFTTEFRDDGKASLALPSGIYSVTVFANGYERSRALVNIAPGEVTSSIAHLTKSRREPPSFEQQLRKYGLDLKTIAVRDLDIGEGQKVELHPRNKSFDTDRHDIRLTTVDELKGVLGNSDEFFPGQYPRYGKAALPENPGAKLAEQLSIEGRFALREYVYGNSRTVSQWKESLTDWLRESPVDFSIFAFNVVTVGPHAILALNSVGLTCDTLRVHTTGTVKGQGNSLVRLEVGTYEGYA